MKTNKYRHLTSLNRYQNGNYYDLINFIGYNRLRFAYPNAIKVVTVEAMTKEQVLAKKKSLNRGRIPRGPTQLIKDFIIPCN